MEQELSGLMATNFSEVLNKRLSRRMSNSSVVAFIMEIKNVETVQEKLSAIYVEQVHQDQENGTLVHNSPYNHIVFEIGGEYNRAWCLCNLTSRPLKFTNQISMKVNNYATNTSHIIADEIVGLGKDLFLLRTEQF